jgi:hypothetical protein
MGAWSVPILRDYSAAQQRTAVIDGAALTPRYPPAAVRNGVTL